MIQLSKKESIFIYGIYDLVLESHPTLYAYTRTMGQQKVIILSNLTDEALTVTEVEGIMYKHEHLLLANLEVGVHAETTTLQLAPYEARIYQM